jgi:hypothetical protein
LFKLFHTRFSIQGETRPPGGGATVLYLSRLKTAQTKPEASTLKQKAEHEVRELEREARDKEAHKSAIDEKERIDEDDRKSGALWRLEKARSQATAAANAVTYTSPGPGDDAAIVSDLTQDTSENDDQSKSHATAEDNECKTVIGKARKAKNAASTGGIVLTH